jgi:hypothetical protein
MFIVNINTIYFTYRQADAKVKLETALNPQIAQIAQIKALNSASCDFEQPTQRVSSQPLILLCENL